MDADTKGDHKGTHTGQRFLVNTSPRALSLEETSADPHTKVRIPSLVARPAKARSRAVKGVGARSVEKLRISHSGQDRSSSAQAVLTSTPDSSPSEVATPGLSTPVTNRADSESGIF